jgi:hypothetical protein
MLLSDSGLINKPSAYDAITGWLIVSLGFPALRDTTIHPASRAAHDPTEPLAGVFG